MQHTDTTPLTDRRSFLKNLAAAGTAAAAASFTFASAAHANEAVTEPRFLEDVNWAEEFDVIVVGAGIAGLAASITVATEGEGATCLLIEKGDVPNGPSRYSEGIQQYTDYPEEFKVYIQALIGDVTPEDVIDAYVNEVAHSVEWMYGIGAAESDLNVSTFSEDYAAEYPELPNDQYLTNFGISDSNEFGHIHPWLMNWVETHPDLIDYRTGTTFEGLVQNASGTVVGIRANGSYIKATRGVIMCIGGFENDPEMIATYSGVHDCKALAGTLNTGDGHRACLKAGADMWHMHSGAWFWLACRDLEDTRFINPSPFYTNKQYGITVGANGRRFYMDVDGCIIRRRAEFSDIEEFARKGAEYLSVDTGYRHGVTQYGGEWVHLPLPSKAWFICDANGLAAGGMDATVSSDPVADGWAYSADTIEELAKLIEVPAAELAATVETWNRYCDQGKDEAFYRPAALMTKVEAGPFYAMLCKPTVLNTDGGPRRDAQARIVDPYGKPIDGLFSAGEFGSIWGHMYNGMGNIGECCAFGRIAARSALARNESHV